MHKPWDKENIEKMKPKIESVLMEITNLCNYRCEFCLYRLNSKRRVFFPSSKLIEFIRDLETLKAKHVTITGEGEPTLHPDIGKILKCLARTKVKACIQTNGAYGSHLRKAMLLPDETHFNLSFITKEVFSKLNRGIKFYTPKVIENIKYLKSQPKRPRIVIIYIINRYNMPEIDTIVERFNELEVDAVEFKACEAVNGLNDYLMLSKSEAKRIALSLLKQAKKCRFKNNILEISKSFTEDYRGKTIFKDRFSGRIKIPSRIRPGAESDGIIRNFNPVACFNPLRYFYLVLSGDVYPCSWNHLLIEPIGNIKEKGILDILKSKRYRDTIKEHAFNFDINKPKWFKCHGCPDAKKQKGF